MADIVLYALFFVPNRLSSAIFSTIDILPIFVYLIMVLIIRFKACELLVPTNKKEVSSQGHLYHKKA